MRILMCVLLLGVAFAAPAQDGISDPREVAADAFAEDLAALQVSIRVKSLRVDLVHGDYTQAQYAAATEKLLNEAIEGARALAAKWKSNPYVEVDGFNVALGLTGPEISVAFRFK